MCCQTVPLKNKDVSNAVLVFLYCSILRRRVSDVFEDISVVLLFYRNLFVSIARKRLNLSKHSN